MKIKYLKDEAFSDYKKAYMFIGTCHCTFKCCREAGISIEVCHNSEWSKLPECNINNKTIIERYLLNPVTSAIVIGGLEPFDQADELIEFVKDFRDKCEDDIVIYTGYYKDEIKERVNILSKFSNIIIKFGRFIPNKQPTYDDVLGITLANPEQYAEKIS